MIFSPCLYVALRFLFYIFSLNTHTVQRIAITTIPYAVKITTNINSTHLFSKSNGKKNDHLVNFITRLKIRFTTELACCNWNI